MKSSFHNITYFDSFSYSAMKIMIYDDPNHSLLSLKDVEFVVFEARTTN